MAEIFVGRVVLVVLLLPSVDRLNDEIYRIINKECIMIVVVRGHSQSRSADPPGGGSEKTDKTGRRRGGRGCLRYSDVRKRKQIFSHFFILLYKVVRSAPRMWFR